MKKFVLLLVIIIAGCTQSKDNVTFILDIDTNREVYLLQRGTSSVSSPVEAYKMDKVDEGYQVSIDITPNSLYRYSYAVRTDTGLDYEKNIHGQTTSRAVVVKASDTIRDTFIKTGTEDIKVTVLSGTPLRGIVVTSEGKHRLTMSDGKTTLDSITPGAIVTIYDLNGLYEPVSVIASDNIVVDLIKRELTTVTFNIKNNSEIEKIRVTGMIGQFGYKYFQVNELTFDEDGGQLLDLDDEFNAEILLPIGEVLYYSYTSGNSNYGYEVKDYNQVLRSVVITENLVIEDTVNSFKNENDVLITFNPDYIGDLVLQFNFNTIRFNDNISIYIQKNTLLEYRYSLSVEGYSSENLGDLQIEYYYGYNNYRTHNVVSDETLNDKIDGFLTFEAQLIDPVPKARNIFTGIMMADYWNSTYYNQFETVISRLEYINPDYLMNSPVWNFNSIIDIPRLESTGQHLYSVSIPDDDLAHWADVASEFKLALYQQVNPEMMDTGVADFFTSGAKTDEWWDLYIFELERFFLYYADVAEENDFDLIRLPDTFIGETLGMFSNFEQAEKYDLAMSSLVDKIQEVYSGQIYTSVEIYNNFEYHFTYLEKMDYLSNKHWFSILDLNAAENKFVEELAIYKLETEKYGVPYFVDQVAFFIEELSLEDIDLVPAYYDMIFTVINDNDWIEGVVIFGYPYVEGGSVITVADNVIKEWFQAFKQ